MKNLIFLPIVLLVFLISCQSISPGKNIYEKATQEQASTFKRVGLPLVMQTKFLISQGAFGTKSHNEPGNEYSWDFDVPVGTPVVAVESGRVISVYQPNKGSGCEPQMSDLAHNIKIEHKDGTVAQYVHIQTDLKEGDPVRRGQEIARTALNGWICSPQLHFGVYASRNNLYDSPQRKTIPVTFDGLPERGLAVEGFRGVVPFPIEINLVKPGEKPEKVRSIIQSLLVKYDLSPYFFTRKIQIEPLAIPHSHPVLTLNTRHLDEDKVLSVFLHEQIHWFLDIDEPKTNKVIAELKKMFPKAPVGGAEGGRDLESTYLHLIVNWFELQADKKYLGEKQAYDLIKGMDVYTWIYKTVLENESKIGQILEKNQLTFHPSDRQ